MNRHKAVILISLLVIITTSCIAQTKLLLYQFEPRGVDTTIIRMTNQLLRDELNATYKYIVIDPAQGTTCYSLIAAAESSKKYNVPKALIGSIMVIGTKTYLSYQLVDATTTTLEFADKVEMPSVEEYPTMCERIAMSIVEKKPYTETAEMEKITEPEVEPGFKRPRKPYASVFLTAGYMFNPQDRVTPAGTILGKNLVNLNLAVSFETPSLLTMMQMGMMRCVYDERDMNFDIILNYLMGKGDFAPFAGAGIGITRYSWKEPSAYQTSKDDGLSLSAGVGVLGLRSYYFRLLTAVYGNYTFTNKFGAVPGVRVLFGVTSPSLGPDATVKIGPGCIGGIIGAMFVTGLILAITS